MNYNLAAIEFQIASEIEFDPDGKATFSIRAVARLADVSPNSLIKAFSSDHLDPSKLAKFLAEQGFEGDHQKQFAEQGIPDRAIGF